MDVTIKYVPTYNIYTYLYMKFKVWKEFLWQSHFSFTRKQEFWKKLLLLYINGSFYNDFIFSPSMLIFISTNKTTERHIKVTFDHGWKCHTLSSRELPWLIPWRWLHTMVNRCGTSFRKIYHGLHGWYVLNVFKIISDSERRLKP